MTTPGTPAAASAASTSYVALPQRATASAGPAAVGNQTAAARWDVVRVSGSAGHDRDVVTVAQQRLGAAETTDAGAHHDDVHAVILPHRSGGD